jgi:hypothetical protein
VNAEQAFDRDALVDLVSADATSVQIVLCWKRDAGRRYRVERVQMIGDLPGRFKDRAIATAAQLRDHRVPRPYDPEWPLGDTECFELESDPPVGGDLFQQLDDFGSLPWFEMSQRRRAPNLYVVITQLPDDSMAFFGRRITERSVLRSGGLRAIWDGDTFSTLDDTVVAFPEDHDWVAWRNKLMILNEKNFHALFRDIPGLQNAVAQHVATIVAVIPIVNQEAFVERCRGNAAMMTKLGRVVENQLYLQPVTRLREYADEYHIDVRWENDSLVFDGSLEQQWNILKLLDEAGTLGPVSGRKYETAAKIEI